MNKKVTFGLLLFFLTVGSFLKLPQAFAAEFTSASLRLDHQTPNTALSGTVCAQSSSAGVENKVIIAFPKDFMVSGNTANWTANTNNLPSGATAWPGIGTPAISVSGQSVTFSSGDLTSSGAFYCFNFDGSTSSATGDNGNDELGEVTTKNSTNTIINSTTYAVSIIASDQIGITAIVPPAVSDLPISIEAETAGSNLSQRTILNYKITYGSLTAMAFPLTIQAQWSQGTIDGSPTPSVDLLDYVIGSASNAYGATPAVVDTTNRTITWTIPSFPANTVGKTLTFELVTNNSYTGSNTVGFDVAARSISESTVTPDQTVSQTYLYDASLEPTPTATPNSGSGTTTGVSQGTTSTPTTAPSQSLTFSGIVLQTLSQNQAQIDVLTNNNSTITIQYGTSLKSLSQSVSSTLPMTEALLTLPNLNPNTDYYYRVVAKDAYGNIVKSDIFTFTTAVASEIPSADLQSLIVTSNNILLNAPQAQKLTAANPVYSLVIPQSSIFEIHFSLTKYRPIKSIQIIIENKNVLGDSTFATDNAASNFVNLVETQPGVYTGRLLSQQNPGVYELYAKIIDYNGNITMQKMAEIIVVPKFKILVKGTNNPIENARILLYLYNPTTKIYDIISPQIIPVNNPSFSDPNGVVPIVLPHGKYKADISAIGYNSKTVAFEIGVNDENYPTIYLQNQPFSLSNYIDFFATTLSDYISSSQQTLSEIAASSRLFALLESLTLLGFVFLAFLSFSAKTHVYLLYIPYFFWHKFRQIAFRNNSLMIGKVYDDVTQTPVSKAFVSIIGGKKNNLLAHLRTNRLGEFYYKKFDGTEKIRISVMKKGFIPSRALEYSNKTFGQMPITIGIEKDNAYRRSILEIVVLSFENILGAFLEFFLIFAVILEIYFIPPLGILRVLPFLILSIFNGVIFILYLYKPHNLILNSPLAIKRDAVTA